MISIKPATVLLALSLMLGQAALAQTPAADSDAVVTPAERPDPCAPPKRDAKKESGKKKPAAKTPGAAKPR